MYSIQQPQLAVSESLINQAWQSSRSFSSPEIQWRVYLNLLCQDTVLLWLQNYYALNATVLRPNWEFVTGSVILLNRKRFVLIPSLSIDHSELRVPEMWVDDPEWKGDYFIAVQVEPDDQWIEIWGYSTQLELKLHGHFDSSDRTYSLDAADLIQDLSVLAVVQQINPEEVTSVKDS